MTEEQEAQVARLKYILSQGCKEGLVSSPLDWPGLNSAGAQISGQAMRGVWIDRTGLYLARRGKGGRKVKASDFTEELALELAPLPCWAHLSPEEYQSRSRDLVEEIERETAALHRSQGTQPLGWRAVLKQRPLKRPTHEPVRKPAPRVHAATKAARARFLEAYRVFVRAYRLAAARFRSGDREAEFPEGSFPPAGPFVEPIRLPQA